MQLWNHYCHGIAQDVKHPYVLFVSFCCVVYGATRACMQEQKGMKCVTSQTHALCTAFGVQTDGYIADICRHFKHATAFPVTVPANLNKKLNCY